VPPDVVGGGVEGGGAVFASVGALASTAIPALEGLAL
jgi:hypothetical protein